MKPSRARRRILRGPSPARVGVTAIGVMLGCGLLRDAHASWPPPVGADLANAANWPNDPEYADRWDYFSFLPTQTSGAPAYLDADHLLGASGMSVDAAWEYSTGLPSVHIVIIDSGIEWEERDLIEQVWLNPSELSGDHMPLNAKGERCGGTGALAGYDCNGDRAFTVSDYAEDPRITPIVPGDPCVDPSTGIALHDRITGDANHNCVLDAGDLILLFSDGVDDDSPPNGYVDDIAGWDFYKNDNDPYDDTRSSHGTTEALEAAAQGNNGIENVGVCPGCKLLMLRAGDSAVVDSNDLAKALAYAADHLAAAGAVVVDEAVSPANFSAFARAATDYAYSKGVVIVATMGDQNSRHHLPTTAYAHTLAVHGVAYGGTSPQDTSSFLNFVHCGNYGGQLALSASTPGCADQATAGASGLAALVASYGLSLSPPVTLSAEEAAQIQKVTADVIDVPESRDTSTASGYYESLATFSERFGYGRPNAARALSSLRSGLIPPEVDIGSPAWFATLYADRSGGPVPIIGRIVAPRAESYSYEVAWAPGVEPLESDFTALASPVSNVPGQTVSGGANTPLAALDPSALDPSHLPDPDSPHHENDRTITLRVRAVAHYKAGEARGEARRTLALVNRQDGLDTDLLPGFPFYLPGSVEGSVKLADINGDGVRDIVVATNDGQLHVLSGVGGVITEATGFPYALSLIDGADPSSPDPSVPSYLSAPAYVAGSNGGVDPSIARESIDGAPAIGDVTGSDTSDIVFASWAGTLYAVDHAGHDLPGWPQRLPDVPSCPTDPTAPHPPSDCMDGTHDLARGAAASPVLVDITGDGILDIILAAFDGNVYAFQGNGKSVPGFPVRVHSPEASRYERIVGTPAVADFNGDGIPDILVGTNETSGSQGATGYYYVIDGRGSAAPGGPYLAHWPVLVPSPVSSPIFGQGTTAAPAILSPGSHQLAALLQSNAGAPLVVPADPGAQQGTAPPANALPAGLDGGGRGFAPLGDFGPLTAASSDELLPLFSHPAVGDLDQDGTPDVVMAGSGLSYVHNLASKAPSSFQHLLGAWSGKTGQMMPASPIVLEDEPFMASPAIADITGDGYPEILVGTGGYFVHAVDACGREAQGWPKFTGGWTMGAPAVGNITRGHTLDVVVGTREGAIYAWETRGLDTGVIQWESFHHDNQNSGDYGLALDQGTKAGAATPLVCGSSGTGDAGATGADGGTDRARSGGCRCRASTERPETPWLAAVGAGLLAWARRQKRGMTLPGAARRAGG